jgi:hypothetical protein
MLANSNSHCDWKAFDLSVSISWLNNKWQKVDNFTKNILQEIRIGDPLMSKHVPFTQHLPQNSGASFLDSFPIIS